MMENWNLFDIQHFCNGDGPGIRTTLFFGGCPLRCPWCHNPECFANTKTLPVEQVMQEVLHDLPFYKRSNGGVTVSGGEPLARQNQCMEVLQMLKENGLHTALDTSLAVEIADTESLVSLCDLFMVDIKTPFDHRFEEVCGGNLETVRKNVQKLAERGANIAFRVPLIPGFNMDDASVQGIIQWVSQYPDYSVTLLPFHRLGRGKYEKLGMEYAYADVEPSPQEEIEAIRQKFLQAGLVEKLL